MSSTDTMMDEKTREQARALQRRGLTLSEIAREMDVDRRAIVDQLYTRVVGNRHQMVRLRAEDGRYLHADGERLTLVRSDAWLGTPQQLFEMRQQSDLSGLTVVRP